MQTGVLARERGESIVTQTVSHRQFDGDDFHTDRSGPDGELPTVETLQLVTDGTRRAILMTLWEAADVPLGFTTLRRRSGIEESARFNYHLQRLSGPFVRDTGRGYCLTETGEQFITAMCAAPLLDERAE
jgi:hypothetical protein